LPLGTFSQSETPEEDLWKGRLLVFVFNCLVGCVLVYTLAQIFLVGRIETIKSSVKVDVVPAPSVAICPYEQNTELIMPSTNPYDWVRVFKVSPEGRHPLSAQPRRCSYDRNCVCVDLADNLNATLRDHKSEETSMIGSTGSLSKSPVVFNEHIELIAAVQDPSRAEVLKVGLYDRVDKAATFWYVNQGTEDYAQLELQVWTMTDTSLSHIFSYTVPSVLQGDFRSLGNARHIWRIWSQNVGTRGSFAGWNETTIMYEMKTFFIEEIISSQNAFSVYTLFMLFVMFLGRQAVMAGLMDAFVPAWEAKGTIQVRELSPLARYLCCQCCIRNRPLADQEAPAPTERTPLVA